MMTKSRAPFTCFAALVLLPLALSGCDQQLGVDESTFVCENDRECGSGYECVDDSERGKKVCLPEGRANHGNNNNNNDPDPRPLPDDAQMVHASEDCAEADASCPLMLEFQQDYELAVELVDGDGGAVEDATVSFDLRLDSAGGASLGDESAVTDSQGRASVNLNTGSQAGLATVTATAGEDGNELQISWSVAVVGSSGGAVFVDATNETDKELERVRVELVDTTTPEVSCEQLVSTVIPAHISVPRNTVDVVEPGEIPRVTVTGLDRNASYYVLATGFTAGGVRRAVGCEEDVTASGAEPLDVSLGTQMPVFADRYDTRMRWDVAELVDTRYGELLRGLARLPAAPGTALFGCPHDGVPTCDKNTGQSDEGMLSVLQDEMPPEAWETFDSVLQSQTLRAAAIDALNQQFQSAGFVGDKHQLWTDIEELSSSVEATGRADFRYRTFTQGDPVQANLSDGYLTPQQVIHSACPGDDELCGNEVGSNVPYVDFNEGTVTGDSISFTGTQELYLELWDHFLEMITRVIYASHLTLPNYSPDEGVNNVLAQISCDEFAVDTTTDANRQQQLRNACFQFTDNLVTWMYQRDYDFTQVTSTNLVAGNCSLGESDYAESAWWQDSNARPMPAFEFFGQEQECEVQFELVVPPDISSTPIGFSLLFSGTAVNDSD